MATVVLPAATWLGQPTQPAHPEGCGDHPDELPEARRARREPYRPHASCAFGITACYPYRLSRAGPEAQQNWKEIHRTGSGADAEAFVQNVTNGKTQEVKNWRAVVDREESQES